MASTRRRELRRARGLAKRLHVRELPLRVVVVDRVAHRRAEDLAVPERRALDPPAELGVLLVPLRIRLPLVEHEDAYHGGSV